uniref:60S ribosomal protein L35-like n=1 Tax=Halichoerus grypus TaxID=9711 RepID=UPI0016593D97
MFKIFQILLLPLWWQWTVRAGVFHTKREELLKRPEELKVELSQLRAARVTGCAAAQLSQLDPSCWQTHRQCSHHHQPDSARELREFHKGKKYKPLDLRPQKTCARCRRLNKQEENLKTKMQQQKEQPSWLQESTVKGRASSSIKHKHTG